MTAIHHALIVAGLALSGCTARSTPSAPESPLPGPSATSDRLDPNQPANGPDGGPDNRPRVAPDCFDVYADCPATIGLPALSTDGNRIAVPDLGADDPQAARDEFVLTVRFLAVDSGAVLSEIPLVTREDHFQAADPGTGEFSPAFRAELDRRVAAFARVMAKGQFRPLTGLGKVHEQRSSDPQLGVRAHFDGTDLSIVDAATGAIHWRHAIPRSQPSRRATGESCGPFPIAEIAVWVSRSPRLALLRVSYISSEPCLAQDSYIVLK